MSTIEPTDEMIYAFAGEPEITATDAHAIKVGLTAVLAIVARDRCLEARGHVWHPLRPGLPGRGAHHPHYCVSCSDGEKLGTGCGNCRNSGYDQTPWPNCRECQ